MSKLYFSLIFIITSSLSNARGSFQGDDHPGETKKTIPPQEFIKAVLNNPSYLEELCRQSQDFSNALSKEAMRITLQRQAKEEERKAEEESQTFQIYKSWHETVFITFNENGSEIDESNKNVWEFSIPTIDKNYKPEYKSTLAWEQNYTFSPSFLKEKKPNFESCKNAKKDERKLVSSPYQWPYSICGKLLINYGEVGLNLEERDIGTGTLISPRHVLTAGHNIYNPSYDDNKLATEIKFLYATSNNDSPPSVQWKEVKVKQAFLVSKWAKHRYKSIYDECDYGLLVLEEEINNLHIPLNNKTSNAQGSTNGQEKKDLIENKFQHDFYISIADSVIPDSSYASINIAGFPQEIIYPAGFLPEQNKTPSRVKTHIVNTHNKHQMFMASGGSLIEKRVFHHGVDVTRGQSGALLYYLINEEGGGLSYHGVGIHTKGQEKESHPEFINKAVMINRPHLENIMMWVANS